MKIKRNQDIERAVMIVRMIADSAHPDMKAKEAKTAMIAFCTLFHDRAGFDVLSFVRDCGVVDPYRYLEGVG